MIHFDRARDIVMQQARLLEPEKVPLPEAAGRILAKEIHADRDFPHCSLSAMDGYACRAADRNAPLTVVETIAAGQMPAREISPGQCSQIMTGAPVPWGADAVVMVEHTTRHGDTVRVNRSGGKSNIRYRGEELRKGDTVLPRGVMIAPPYLAVLASVGCDPVPVYRRPKAGVIATGTELVEPSQTPAPGQIRNSNSYQLCAQLARAGAEASYRGIAPDTPETTREAIEEAMADTDVLLLSGGVSMGEFDFVPGVLTDLGVKLLFEKVAIQPGKPTVFGAKGDTLFFGLPGNPVSTFVIFELLVRPFLYRMMGSEWRPPSVLGRLNESISRKKADRLSFRPVYLDSDGGVRPVAYHGSGHIHAYVNANGIVALPVGVARLDQGETIAVRLL